MKFAIFPSLFFALIVSFANAADAQFSGTATERKIMENASFKTMQVFVTVGRVDGARIPKVTNSLTDYVKTNFCAGRSQLIAEPEQVGKKLRFEMLCMVAK